MSEIKIPSIGATIKHLVVLSIMSGLALLLDEARGVAFILFPIIVFNQWAREANIRWSVTKKGVLAVWLASIAYSIVGIVILAATIASESGELSLLLALSH
ncbi:hypothetical protein ASL83_003258 [Vibrio parahaemolyticus]|nr:hypothetical protein [Vibrio parahaemolyticus]